MTTLIRYTNPSEVKGGMGGPAWECPACHGKFDSADEARECARADHARRYLTAAAERGLKLGTAKARKAGPRAQVQDLVRIARRAMLEADWLEVGLGIMRPADYQGSGDPESFHRFLRGDEAAADKVTILRAKVEDATAACIYLNARHELGYPIPS